MGKQEGFIPKDQRFKSVLVINFIYFDICGDFVDSQGLIFVMVEI